MKKYLTVLFLVAFIVPSVAFASWWNPFSWSKDSKQTIDVIEPTPVQSTDKNDSKIETKPKEVKETKVVEKIVEKPVIQTITVQDPALQAKINALILENTNLKAEIERLKKANKSLSAEPESTVLSQFTEKCLEAKKDILDSKEQIAEIDDKYNDIYEEYMSKYPERNPERYKQVVDTNKAKELSSLRAILSGGLADKELYCD